MKRVVEHEIINSELEIGVGLAVFGLSRLD